MTFAEQERAVGKTVMRRVRVLNHDPEDVVPVGATSRGTPVEFFRAIVESDLRVCLGNLELHYFAGYSGGVKAIFPGCASRATVTANHAMMVRPRARAGRIEGNPVRADIEEGAALLGVDFILNVIAGEHGRIVGAFAGDAAAAHRAGCVQVAQRGIVRIGHLADIALVSAGGYPKDVNLYQAQKALDNAAGAVRTGGTIILIAECREGMGNRTFETWMREASGPDDLLRRIQTEFALGGHKAAAIAAVEKRATVALVSELPDEVAIACGLRPYGTVDEALRDALHEAGPGAKVLVMPQGGSVLPVPG
jgi:nickel-dependent lactate racemase